MARGWESKAVEAQIESAGTKPGASRQQRVPTEAQIDLLRKKESLVLSRTRILHELESASNSRYRAMLNLALADQEAKLALLGE